MKITIKTFPLHEITTGAVHWPSGIIHVIPSNPKKKLSHSQIYHSFNKVFICTPYQSLFFNLFHLNYKKNFRQSIYLVKITNEDKQVRIIEFFITKETNRVIESGKAKNKKKIFDNSTFIIHFHPQTTR